ncbi:MAG: FixH family protein [Flavobacteriales bacterium]|nr:FixH family protein [Flavobacteriales bacterium]
MKINWGTGAFIFFGGFVVFMLSLVYLSTQQRNELVTEDYYEKELDFKEILKKKERTNLLSEQLEWKIENNEFIVSFPKDVGSNISGTIIFFKPSSQKDDKEIPFQINSNIYRINIKDYSKGMYKIKIDWKVNNTEYYDDDQIIIP